MRSELLGQAYLFPPLFLSFHKCTKRSFDFIYSHLIFHISRAWLSNIAAWAHQKIISPRTLNPRCLRKEGSSLTFWCGLFCMRKYIRVMDISQLMKIIESRTHILLQFGLLRWYFVHSKGKRDSKLTQPMCGPHGFKHARGSVLWNKIYKCYKCW